MVADSARATTSLTKGPTLTRVQLAAWASWVAPQWAPFKDAWLARGLRMPPSQAQREALWAIADARPHDLARWVRSAPVSAPPRIVEYVLRQWNTLMDGIMAGINEAEAKAADDLEADRRESRAAMQRIGELLPR